MTASAHFFLPFFVEVLGLAVELVEVLGLAVELVEVLGLAVELVEVLGLAVGTAAAGELPTGISSMPKLSDTCFGSNGSAICGGVVCLLRLKSQSEPSDSSVGFGSGEP